MGVPKLRFKADDGSDFPDWTFRTFGSVVEEFNDRTTTENEDVLLSCAIDGMYLNSELFGHQRGASNIGYKKITKGALILSVQNLHLGNANVNTRFEHGIVSPAYKTFHIVGCLTEFMSAWVKRHAARKFFYDATTVGASQCRRNVDWEELYQQTIAVPSPSEQRKIADLLSAVDDVISAQEAEVAAWEKRKKGVMQKLFSQEVRFKADDGSDFPDWEEKTLGELGCFCSGIGFSERYQGHANLPVDVYKVSDMNISGNEREMLRANNTVDESILKKMKTKAIDQPSIIFAKVGAAIFAERKRIARKPFIVDNNMMVFTPNDENDFEYIYWLTLTLRFASRAQIGALPSYNASDISGFVVNIPSLPEQRKIADCLASLDDVIAKAKDELDAWCELKKGLLQQMFV